MTRRLNIVKMSIFPETVPNLQIRCKISVRIPVDVFVETDNLILIWNCKEPRRAKTFLKEEQKKVSKLTTKQQ